MADSAQPLSRREALWQAHREKWKALVEEHPLRYVFLEVTRRCNLACVYCGSSCTPKAQREEMPVSSWIDIVRQIANDFDSKQIMVAVTGGEPLLKEGVDELFYELSAQGFAYGMVTNGYFLDEARARKLVDAGMRSISISMDAPAEINDRLRGRGASKKVEGRRLGLCELRDSRASSRSSQPLPSLSFPCWPICASTLPLCGFPSGVWLP